MRKRPLIKACSECTHRIILVSARQSEDSRDGVADVLLHDASVAFQARPHLRRSTGRGVLAEPPNRAPRSIEVREHNRYASGARWLPGWRSAEHTPCRIVPGRDCFLHSSNTSAMEVSINPNLGRLTRSPSRSCENRCPSSGQRSNWPKTEHNGLGQQRGSSRMRPPSGPQGAQEQHPLPASGLPDRLQPIGDPWGRCPFDVGGGPMIGRSPSRRSRVDAGSACTSSLGGST